MGSMTENVQTANISRECSKVRRGDGIVTERLPMRICCSDSLLASIYISELHAFKETDWSILATLTGLLANFQSACGNPTSEVLDQTHLPLRIGIDS